MKMVSNRKKKNQREKQFSQLHETLNDFVVGNNVNVNVSETENLEQQTNAQPDDFERVEKSVRRNQVIENNIDEQIRRAVNNGVMTVKNHMHDAILTAIDNVVTTRVQMAVKSITISTGHGTNREVQKP